VVITRELLGLLQEGTRDKKELGGSFTCGIPRWGAYCGLWEPW
jgi:hypothetical protein